MGNGWYTNRIVQPQARAEVSLLKWSYQDQIIDLARQFGLDVVAEGIETRDQFETLKRLGCDRLQGFWFNRPVTAQELEPLLELKNGAPKSLMLDSTAE